GVVDRIDEGGIGLLVFGPRASRRHAVELLAPVAAATSEGLGVEARAREAGWLRDRDARVRNRTAEALRTRRGRRGPLSASPLRPLRLRGFVLRNSQRDGASSRPRGIAALDWDGLAPAGSPG